LRPRIEPAVLALSRQPLPTLDRGKYAPASGVARGADVAADAPGGKPGVILIGPYDRHEDVRGLGAAQRAAAKELLGRG